MSARSWGRGHEVMRARIWGREINTWGHEKKYDDVGPKGKRNECAGVRRQNMMAWGQEKTKTKDSVGSRGKEIQTRGHKKKYDGAGSREKQKRKMVWGQEKKGMKEWGHEKI